VSLDELLLLLLLLLRNDLPFATCALTDDEDSDEDSDEDNDDRSEPTGEGTTLLGDGRCHVPVGAFHCVHG